MEPRSATSATGRLIEKLATAGDRRYSFAIMITPVRLSYGVLALTVSLKLAIGALVFLVVIHKLEYFLNNKIIGERIRNPVWLTLIALVIGERLMGIPGLIPAPVVLNYLRVEMLKVEWDPRRSQHVSLR